MADASRNDPSRRPPGEPSTTPSSIKILKGLEAVRKRPGMYIGDTSDGTGLHHMVFEVVDNAIDEALAGLLRRHHGHHPYRQLDLRRWTTGAASPPDIKDDDELKRSAAEIVMTELHAGGKFDQNTYKVSGGPARRRRVRGQRAVGMAAADGSGATARRTSWNSATAVAVEPLEGDRDRPTSAAPRCISSPRAGLFGQVDFHYDILAKRLRELSFLNNGVKIELIDQRTGKEENFASRAA